MACMTEGATHRPDCDVRLPCLRFVWSHVYNWLFPHIGGLFMSALAIRALLFGVHIEASHF